MGRYLDWIQDNWSSDDPEDRIPAWLAKFFVEGSLFFLVSVLLGGVAGLLFTVAPSHLHPSVTAGGVFVSTLGILFGKSFCNLIPVENSI